MPRTNQAHLFSKWERRSKSPRTLSPELGHAGLLGSPASPPVLGARKQAHLCSSPGRCPAQR